MRFGLPDAAIEAIRAVLRQWPQVDRAVIYGSRAKGTYTEGSDIDLTLVGGSDLTLRIRNRIATALEDLMLPYRIDLSVLTDIEDPAVQGHTAQRGAILFDRKEARGAQT